MSVSCSEYHRAASFSCRRDAPWSPPHASNSLIFAVVLDVQIGGDSAGECTLADMVAAMPRVPPVVSRQSRSHRYPFFFGAFSPRRSGPPHLGRGDRAGSTCQRPRMLQATKGSSECYAINSAISPVMAPYLFASPQSTRAGRLSPNQSAKRADPLVCVTFGVMLRRNQAARPFTPQLLPSLPPHGPCRANAMVPQTWLSGARRPAPSRPHSLAHRVDGGERRGGTRRY